MTTQTTALNTFTADEMATAQLSTQQHFPDLTTAAKHIVPLSIEYWSPTEAGEEKLVYIHSIGDHDVPDLETGDIKTLECVMLLENSNGTIKRFINASRVLVGNIRDAVNRGEIIPATTLTPLSITYLGTRKNRSNAFSSSCWQIIPLVVANERDNAIGEKS